MVHKMVIQVKDLENTQQNNEYLSRLENTLLTMIVEIIGNVVTHSKADFSQC
jgi:hypothetical protein